MALVTKGTIDIELKTLAPDIAGYTIFESLSVKGYCVINPGAEAQQLESALADISAIDAEGRFERLPPAVARGLLGVEGSQRAADLEPTNNAEGTADGESIRSIDKLTTDMVAMVAPYLERIDIDVRMRGVGIVVEGGADPFYEDPPMTPELCDRYLSTFSRGKVMCIWCLGPEPGTLELSPFDEDANTHDITIQPGTFVILRADAIGHRFESTKKSYCLASFLLAAKIPHKRMLSLEEHNPACQELLEYAQAKIREFKESDADEQSAMDLPRHWEFVMNHSHFVGQHISVRTAAIRHPTTWQQLELQSALLTGPDMITEIPLTRWDYRESYDPDPNGYQWGRHYVQHGSFLDGAEFFDNTIFRISRAEAGGMDVGHRMILESGYEALVRDGYKVNKLINSRGGVYVANPPPLEWNMAEKTCSQSGVCGGGGSVACGRISFTHGMKGPCVSVDVEAASSLTALNFCCANLSRAGRWEPIPFGLTTSWNLNLGPTFLYHHCAQGNASITGRACSFDASASGWVRAENATSLVLKSLTDVEDGRLVVKDFTGQLGAMSSTAVNQSGRRSSFTALDARAMQEVMSDAVRHAELSPLDVDCVETFCRAKTIEDAVESSATAKAFRPEGMDGCDDAPPLGLMSYVSNFGNAIEVHGLAAVLKICLTAQYGVIVPNIHFKILNPYMDLDLCERNAHIGAELLEFRTGSSYSGVMNRSSVGTNCFGICWGQIAQERVQEAPIATKTEKILFWPEGGGQLSDEPSRDYTIAGTFNYWKPEKMESEGSGCFGYTLTLGINGWESFQIQLDGDLSMVLHPGAPQGAKGERVLGPDAILRKDSWLVDGRSWFATVGPTAIADGVTSNHPDAGEPGDQYRVHLRVSGKWRMVDWEKLAKQEGVAARPAVDTGSYQVVGSWFDYNAQPMYPEGTVPGLYVLEFNLPTDGGGYFNILRDNDWGQTFYPYPDATPGGEVIGPEEATGDAWVLNGRAGDVFRIEFQRIVEPGSEMKQVSWKHLRREAPSKEQLVLANATPYSIHGTWNHLAPTKMLWNGNHYSFVVVLGQKAQASFQIFENGNPSRCFFPDAKDASPHTTYEMKGPGAATLANSWTIGFHENDEAKPGSRYEVRLFPDESGKAVYLDWQPLPRNFPVEDMAGRGFLAFTD
jgi:polyketide synthase-associated protein